MDGHNKNDWLNRWYESEETKGYNSTEIDNWLNSQYTEVAKKLPDLVRKDFTSFECGYQVGYKRALRSLEQLLEELEDKE